jgi:choline dehydrogenase-like flavoprotein
MDEQVQYYKTAVGRDGFLMAVSGARPYSKGYIKLGGTSPYDAPIIDPNYLHDYTDVQVLVEGVKATLQIIENSTALGKDFDAKFTDVSLPGCEHLPFRSDSYWECFVRRSTVTLHHPCKYI